MAPQWKRAAGRAVKWLASSVDRVRPPASGLVILIYHRVGGGSGLDVDMPVSTFAEQMAALATSRRVVSLDEAADMLTGTERPAFDPVVVTFDDGTADFVDHAVPVLVDTGVPATMYLATDFVERGVSFPSDGTAVSWAAMADAVSTGLVTVGSHTHTHALLDRLEPRLTDEELRRSIELIGERLAVEARHFAYPKALLASPENEAIVRQRFITAAIGESRPNQFGRTDLHRLYRSPIQVSDGMRFFHRKVEGGMATEERLRKLINRSRYAGATT